MRYYLKEYDYHPWSTYLMTDLPHNPAKFRRDINGLRAWAVVVVVLFHFQVPGFSGGFIGVDIFFVISGFLMTGIVINGLERNNLSLLDFYMARARRIMPALIGMCLVLLGLGWFLLLPPDYAMLSTHAISSASFISNVKYWAEAGYFDVASHEKWLLHTWSLSVEWQFYIVLPIALWVTWHVKPGRQAQIWVLGLCLIASLFASVWTTANNPTTAFFMLHTRAWEMLSGGLVFLLSPHFRIDASKQRWLETAGFIAILATVAILDSRSIWPGWRAAIPVIATAMVLLAHRTSFWTASKAAQWLGDRSYSLYLWHWPIYVALGYAEIQSTYMGVIGGLIGTLLFGNLSYVFVENSARKILSKMQLRTGIMLLTLATIGVLAPAQAIRQQEGVKGRFSPAIELAAAEASNVNPRRSECHSLKGSTSPSCVFGGEKWRVITVGDSHIVATISAIAQASPTVDAGVVQWSYSGCPFVPGIQKVPGKLATLSSDYRCTEFNEWARAKLGSVPSSIPVVIIGRYAQAAFGRNDQNENINIPEMYFSKPYAHTTAEFLEEFSQHIITSACELAKRRTVYMMRPIPEMGIDIPKTLSRRMAFGFKSDISIPIEQYQKRNDWVWKAQDAAHEQCGIKILDPTRYLCSNGRCFGSKNGRPLYFDDDHLSEFGNKLLVPMFSAIFEGS